MKASEIVNASVADESAGSMRKPIIINFVPSDSGNLVAVLPESTLGRVSLWARFIIRWLGWGALWGFIGGLNRRREFFCPRECATYRAEIESRLAEISLCRPKF